MHWLWMRAPATWSYLRPFPSMAGSWEDRTWGGRDQRASFNRKPLRLWDRRGEQWESGYVGALDHRGTGGGRQFPPVLHHESRVQRRADRSLEEEPGLIVGTASLPAGYNSPQFPWPSCLARASARTKSLPRSGPAAWGEFTLRRTMSPGAAL